MQTIAIKCPRCQKGFRLQSPNLGAMQSKVFKCPACGMQASFGQLMQNGQTSGYTSPTTNIVSAPSAAMPGGKTHVAASGKAYLLIESTGAMIPLMQGSYTIGRASSDSPASLKIAADPYMSRLHAKVDVAITPSGVKCIITSMNPTNAIFVNNCRLVQGMQAELKNNDRILLGMTTAIFRTK